MISLCGRYYVPSEYEMALNRRDEAAKAVRATGDMWPLIRADQDIERVGNRLFGERNPK